jgi:acyl-CoA thioesterase-1
VDIARRLPVFRRSLAQVEDYATRWARHNAASRTGDGPLWVVLGDSAAQGVGASSHLSGYVGVVRDRLEARDGRPWRVVNLSRSGARTREVVDVQWPAAAALEADLLTAVVGGNDALRTREALWRRDVEDLCATLPSGAVVATVARGVFERKTARVNALLRERAAERGLRVADLWAHTGPPYRGLYFDGFHPNDRGYLQWADALWEVLSG